METVYLALGSNLDNPQEQIVRAFESIRKLPQTQLIQSSSLYLSPPMGPQDQPAFVNAVSKLQTELSAIELLNALQSIENDFGRMRKAEQWGPRILDLDIILFGQQIITTERLTVPHYGMKHRSFVIIPLEEIEPQLILPDGTSINHLSKQLISNQLNSDKLNKPDNVNKIGIRKL